MWYENEAVGFVKNSELITSKGLIAHEYTEQEREAILIPPDGKYCIRNSEGRFVLLDVPTPKPLTLAEALSAKLAELRSRRLALEYGGFELDGQRWDSELKDEQRLTSMVTLMRESGLPEFGGWKIAEGVYIVLTFELALAAAQAMFRHYAWCFAEEARNAAEISALTTVEAVQAYNIEFNMQGA